MSRMFSQKLSHGTRWGSWPSRGASQRACLAGGMTTKREGEESTKSSSPWPSEAKPGWVVAVE
eukprot:9846941-Lingulodinium_polyedra.AAC.1